VTNKCEFPSSNASASDIASILKNAKTIALVGLSDNPDRPSYRVAAYLKEKGFRIIPVNPAIDQALGEKAYPTLVDVPETVDIVDIFRKPESVPEIVEQAVKIGAQTVWMQEGIIHNQAAERVASAGLRVVMDKCMMKEHKAAFGGSVADIPASLSENANSGPLDFSFDLSAISLEQDSQPDPQITYDLIILGGGPAAMTAAVYAARKMMTVCIITKDFGGQMGDTSEIENYMGFQMITGRELVGLFVDQVKYFKVPIYQGELIKEVRKEQQLFTTTLDSSTAFKSRTVILATGKRDRPLNVPGEKELTGKGVAYCATCDAPFFKNKKVFVAGGGNSAFTAVNDLLKVADRVTLINFGQGWQADKIIVETVKDNEKLHMLDNRQITAIEGAEKVTGIRLKDRATGEETTQAADGIFIEIGLLPNSDPVRNLAALNPAGEVIVDCHCRTNIEGLFGSGDVTTVPHKQIIISAGEGAKAALSAHEYLVRMGAI